MCLPTLGKILNSRRCYFANLVQGTAGAGENIALGYPDVRGLVNAWGTERKNYDYSKPGFTSGTGHFTQIVWKGSTTIGCGRTKCRK